MVFDDAHAYGPLGGSFLLWVKKDTSAGRSHMTLAFQPIPQTPLA